MALSKVNPNLITNGGSRKNLIINGAMQVAQRGTSFTGLTSGQQYVSDRFENQLSSAGTFTFDNTSTAPDGFSNSQRMNCTTAFSVASGTYLIFRHDIEGQNLQEAAFGTSAAKQMTLSFWCRSTKTGSLSVVVRQPDASNRMFSKNVTINTADTWEKKTILIPADTGGTINNDNGSGLQVAWWLNGGSTYGGGSEQTAWGTQTHTNKYTGTINLGASTSDQFYLTGVQLEVGSIATDFEHRTYAESLLACQRYFEVVADGSGADDSPYFGMGQGAKSDQINFQYYYKAEKRAPITMTVATVTNGYAAKTHSTTISHNTLGIGMTHQNLYMLWGYMTNITGVTEKTCWQMQLNGAAALITVSAEL